MLAAPIYPSRVTDSLAVVLRRGRESFSNADASAILRTEVVARLRIRHSSYATQIADPRPLAQMQAGKNGALGNDFAFLVAVSEAFFREVFLLAPGR